MKTYETDPVACPYCGALHDRHTAADRKGGPPVEGDAAVCFTCAGVSVYNADGSQRKPTESERAEFMTDPDVQKAVSYFSARKPN